LFGRAKAGGLEKVTIKKDDEEEEGGGGGGDRFPKIRFPFSEALK